MKIRTQRTLAATLVILTAVAWAAVAPRALWAGADKGPERVARAAAGVGLPAPGRDFSKVQAGGVYTDGRLLVRFAASVTPAQRDAALTALGGTLVEQVDLVPGLCIVALAPGQSIAAALAAYNAVPGVLYAEPDYQRTVCATVTTTQTFPNDPDFPFDLFGIPGSTGQWSLLNSGVAWTTTTATGFDLSEIDPTAVVADSSSYIPRLTLGRAPGQVGADIRAPEAWHLTTGSQAVVVAVIDTGVFTAADDFSDAAGNNLWVNVGEKPGNGLDDDGNGYVDDFGGWDFVDTDSTHPNGFPDPSEVFLDGDSNLYYGHGTHVAGIIGARGDNFRGIAGIAWNVRIMPLRVFDSTGNGTVANEIKAIQYAVIMGADVLNLSFNTTSYNQAESDAIKAAGAAQMVAVVAAGNNGSDNDRAPMFPAGYALKNIVTVMATDYDDNPAGFTNIGRTTVDLGAPGTGILSVAPPIPVRNHEFVPLYRNVSPYSIWSGTSMAAAEVSGAAALMLSYNASMSPDNIRQALDWSAFQQPPAQPLGGKCISGGRLDRGLATNPSSALGGKCISGGRLDLYGALKNIVIQDVQENYFSPYMLEYQFGLRAASGDGISDFLTTSSAVGFQPFEDNLPISPTETGKFLKKAVDKQFNCFVAMDYTGSMQATPAVLSAMETGTVNFIDYMTSQTGHAALIGLYEFHIEDQAPRKVADFSTNANFLDDKILAGGRFPGINETINGFFGGSRCWDAAYDAVNEFSRPGSVLTDEFRTVIVFSDGRDESSLKKPADIIALARQLQVRVYVIGYGDELRYPASFNIPEDLQPETILRQIAFKTGARYYNSNQPGGIAVAYQRLIRDIQSFYVLRWATLKDPVKTTVPSFHMEMTPADALCPRDRVSEYQGTDYPVANFQGDRRQGALRWQVLESDDTTVTAIIRATYVPRDISWFDFFFPGGIDRADLVPAPAGLIGTWSPDPADPTTSGTVHIASPSTTQTLAFGDFGQILKFTVTARPGQTAKERAQELLSLVRVLDTYTTNGQTFTLDTFVLPPEAPKPWTLLFYMNGDNAGEPQALADFLKLATVGTTDTLNIVAQLDRPVGSTAGYGNWSGARRGRIFLGNVPDTTWGQDIGPTDMGDPATLRDFVTWGLRNFPGQRVGLVLWSRGADATSGDTLEAADVRVALADVFTTTSIRPDIIAFDEHLRGMAEVAYELRDSSPLMVGSEATIVPGGIPYGQVVLDMAFSQVEPKNFGESLVDKYALQSTSTTLALLDLTQMTGLADRVDRLAQTLQADWKTNFDACTTASLSVAADLTSVVLHSRNGASQFGSTGLSIYFPAPALPLDPTYDSGKYEFLNAVRWLSFLTDMRTQVPGESLIGQSWVATARSQTKTYGGGVNVDLGDFCAKLRTNVPNSPLPRDWTVLVYMDGDNDLETAALDDFTSMGLVGSDGNVNIVAMLDRAPGGDSRFGDWTDARRGIIRKNDLPTTSWGADVGELDMGDPTTLRDFVQWGETSFPAAHYALIMWDHGQGWKGVCTDVTSGGDILKPAEMRSALEQAQALTGKSLELIGFDASSMGMTEVAYELRDQGGVMVASPAAVANGSLTSATQPNGRLPYAALFSDLASSPTMTNVAFGRRIVTDYLAAEGDSASMAVLDLTAMTAVGAQVNQLAQTLRTFAATDHAACAAAATAVEATLGTAILFEGHGIKYAGSHGLSIYFPATFAAFDANYNGLQLELPSQTQWDEFLADYYATLNRTFLLNARNATFQYDVPENIDLYSFCDAVINNRQRDWTLLVYLDGDNKNESFAIANFLKMASVGSDTNVNVVAMLDRSPGFDTSNGDWSGTRRGVIKQGDVPTTAWGESVGSLDMGAPQTLSGFVEWGMTTFPAAHFALVLWDSGNGWTLSTPAAAPNKSICNDDTSNDFLTLKKIRTALEAVKTDFGSTPEVIGMDASLMSMVETGYELRNVSQFLVASENRTFMPGWPYDKIVTTMESAPLASPQSIAGSMANAAFQFQTGLVAGGDGAATESVIDLTKMGAVGLALDSFASTLNAHWEHEHNLCIAAAGVVVNAVDAAVLSSLHGGSGPASNGLAIYFPLTTAVVSPDYTGLELQLAADTQWDEFLANYTFQMAGSWVDQARLTSLSFTDPLGNPMPNVDLVDFCNRLSTSQAGTIVAKITFKNCTATVGDAAKGRMLTVSGGTPASSVKIQRILAVPAGVTLVDGVGSGGPGVLYLQCNSIAEVSASDSLGTLSSNGVPLGDVFVTGSLRTLSTRGCRADLASASAFRSVKMADTISSATTTIGGNGLPVPAGFKTATVNLVGVSAGLIWLPGQQLTLRTTSKRNVDQTGLTFVTQSNIFTVYGGDAVSVTATGGDAVDSVVARGVLKNLSARGLVVNLFGTRRLFGGFLGGLTDGKTTLTLTVGGGDAAWMAEHPTAATQPPTVIGSINGLREVDVRAVAGYSADTTGGTLVIAPNFTGALGRIGTATFHGAGSVSLGIHGNAYISPFADDIKLSGDKAAETSGRLVVHRAP